MSYKKIKISGLSEMEWLMLRKRSGIGGSEVSAILGLSKFSSPMKVYKDKTTDDIEIKTSESMRVGHDLEEYVAQRFCEATGKRVRKSNYLFLSNEYPMFADVDRFVVGEDAILECKTTNAWGASKWYDGEIPDSYIMQCFHYMAVTGKKTCYIACLIMGVGFVYRTLYWDDDIINALIERESEFWNEYVVPRRLPEVDGSQCCSDIIGSFYPSAEKGSVITLEGFDDSLARRDKIIRQIEELKTEQNKIEQDIKLYMKDNELAINDNYRISWNTVESTRLDSKKLKEEMPEIYNKFSKTSSSRRFQIRVA